MTSADQPSAAADELLEQMENMYRQDMDNLREDMEELRNKYISLEDQLNDLIELHQSEIQVLKSDLTEMESKLRVHGGERLQLLTDHLQSLDNKVDGIIEHRQAQERHIEGSLENTASRQVMKKVVNILIMFIHGSLFLVGAFISVVEPFCRTTPRTLMTTLIVLMGSLIYLNLT